MTPQDISRYQDLFITVATDIGLKILAAIAFWVIGRWLIHLAVRLVRTSLEHQKVDPTVLRYLGSVITVTLNVLLVVGIAVGALMLLGAGIWRLLRQRGRPQAAGARVIEGEFRHARHGALPHAH